MNSFPWLQTLTSDPFSVWALWWALTGSLTIDVPNHRMCCWHTFGSSTRQIQLGNFITDLSPSDSPLHKRHGTRSDEEAHWKVSMKWKETIGSFWFELYNFWISPTIMCRDRIETECRNGVRKLREVEKFRKKTFYKLWANALNKLNKFCTGFR